MAYQRRLTNPAILGIELRSIRPRGPVFIPQLGIYVPGSGDMSAVLTAEIGKYNAVEYLRLLSRLSALREAGPEAFNREMRKEGHDPRELLRSFQIRHLVRVLLQSNAPWNSGVTPHTRDIVMHCEWAYNSLCQADRTFVGEVPGDAYALLWRMAYQQFKDLEGAQDLLRSMFIYRTLMLRTQKRHNYSIAVRFKNITGIDLNDFWLLVMALYGWCLDNPGKQINTGVLSRSKDFPALTKALGTRFLDLVSCDRERYVKNLVYPGTGEPGYEPYNLNPLLKWPLIKIGEDAYVVPSPRDLLERGSSGVYYDLMPIDKGRFGAVLGDAFQEYVGIIMKGLPGIPMVFPETKYFLKGAKRVTCDWIIVDEDTAVLIECKRSAVNALSKVTGARARIKEDISNPNGVVDGVLKILETEQAIRQRYKGLGFLSKVKRFYGLVVVLDDFYMPNSPCVRQIASEALEKHKVALEDRIQFAHVGGLEWLVNLLARPGTSVSAVMHAKTNTSAHVVLDFKNFVPDYATEQLPGEKITPWMSQFNEVYEEFKRDVI